MRTNSQASGSTKRVLQAVLAAMLDPINQLFIHSRMMRLWGHSKGMQRNAEWIEKMRRTQRLVTVVQSHAGEPLSRPSSTLHIGRNVGQVLESDAALTLTFIDVVEAALEVCDTEESRQVLGQILECERVDHALVMDWLNGPESTEPCLNHKYLLPKPGSSDCAIETIDSVLPHMMSLVSQLFYNSLIHGAAERAEQAKRELDAALRMMYRTEAILERLLALGGVPGGNEHGRIDIGHTDRDMDHASLDSHQRIVNRLAAGLQYVSGLADPMSHTLLDGVLRAEQDECAALASTC